MKCGSLFAVVCVCERVCSCVRVCVSLGQQTLCMLKAEAAAVLKGVAAAAAQLQTQFECICCACDRDDSSVQCRQSLCVCLSACVSVCVCCMRCCAVLKWNQEYNNKKNNNNSDGNMTNLHINKAPKNFVAAASSSPTPVACSPLLQPPPPSTTIPFEKKTKRNRTWSQSCDRIQAVNSYRERGEEGGHTKALTFKCTAARTHAQTHT